MKKSSSLDSKFCQEILYTTTHEWVFCQNNLAKVGITAFSQNQLGEIVYIELPKVGQIIKAKEPIVILESTKAALEVYSPVSGKIIKINQRLKKEKELKSLNEDPEEKGWLYQIELSDPKELEKLLDKKSYFSLIRKDE